jgi:Calcineurin-like phosphoesterase
MKRCVLTVLVLSLVAVACETTRLHPVRPSGPTGATTVPTADPIRIAAAGDVACPGPPSPDPSKCQYDATSDLLVGHDIDAVLLLGDTQYPDGRYADFVRYFDPTWGRVIDKTYPVIGNEDFVRSATAPAGYYRYFGDRWRGPDGLGYYSFNLPRGCVPTDALCWHVIALNSELCFIAGGCDVPGQVTGPGQRQYVWLSNDLETHRNDDYPCTIAMFHRPMFDDSGAAAALRPMWELLYGSEVDVVLNGHDHHYERWQQLTPAGVRDPGRGIREFIVGTGGKDRGELTGRPAGIEAAQDGAFGVLKLGLYPESYRWRWVPAAGQPDRFHDASAHPAPCV